MVPIRSPTTKGQSTHRVTLYAAVIAVFVITGIYLLALPKIGSSGGSDSTTSSEVVSPRTALNQRLSAMSSSSGSAPKNKEELDEEDVDPMKITHESVAYGEKTLPYYHCGPLPSHDNPELTELVLLHGAAFTKEDWKSSGILDMLCQIDNEEDEGNLSISALDLPVSADGKELGMAFDALTSNKILSGRAATFVSPSASGKAIVSLGEMAANDINELTRIIKAWIPVASGAVVKAPESTLLQYKSANIPILAIHGDQDAMGKKVTNRLTEFSDAKGVELEGRHPVYLDSPEEFVQEVMQFLDEKGL
eukprot:CAMPEP_0201869868 /NCGR_PEP_ID=MMETSP0902-20130614/3217_1 /ASSEMBLY_ACC=CAM_ASM_000551 /TAXON_ID=420261 /ORGANISM="Thalassiosira antarctica, Strain CCMP982" /LENGTH=306 /DNA_ID=CAMNT_0048395427 /DNA_START=12 /DNA_END=932 /DNA_ORIENTATION=-